MCIFWVHDSPYVLWYLNIYVMTLDRDHTYLTAMTVVGSSPSLATRETSQVLLAGVSGGFPGELPFCPTYRLARLDMSEIILKGTLN